MRSLAYASAAVLLLTSSFWVLSQFWQVGVSYGRVGERWTVKALSPALVIERVHPLPSPEGLHLIAGAVGTLTHGFIGFTATTNEPLPGIRYEYSPGLYTKSYPGRISIMAPTVPNIYLNALAFRWWLLELVAIIVAVPAWWLYLVRRRNEARGFPVSSAHCSPTVSLCAAQHPSQIATPRPNG